MIDWYLVNMDLLPTTSGEYLLLRTASQAYSCRSFDPSMRECVAILRLLRVRCATADFLNLH